MNFKRIVAGTILAGISFLVISLICSFIVSIVAPFDIFQIGGMRSANDPVMILFWFSPIVFSLAAAIVFSVISKSLEGTSTKRAWTFAGLLFLIVVIPNMYLISTSMTYPLGFFIENILTAVIAYPIMGLVFVRLDEIL